MKKYYSEIFGENQHEYIGVYLEELNDVYNITAFDVHTDRAGGKLFYIINFQADNNYNMYNVKENVINRYEKIVSAKYKYYENGTEEVLTMKELEEIYNGKENEEVRKQGSSFEDWIADNVRAGNLN